jgi:hypothetical protein
LNLESLAQFYGTTVDAISLAAAWARDNRMAVLMDMAADVTVEAACDMSTIAAQCLKHGMMRQDFIKAAADGAAKAWDREHASALSDSHVADTEPGDDCRPDTWDSPGVAW